MEKLGLMNWALIDIWEESLLTINFGYSCRYRISSYKTRGYNFLQALQLRVLLERGY